MIMVPIRTRLVHFFLNVERALIERCRRNPKLI
jgi:hypothetical protein